MGYCFWCGIFDIDYPMKNILKNRLFAASLMFLLLNLAGAFLIMAPLLVILRNRFDHSRAAFDLWPVISPLLLTDILINDTQMLGTFIISAVVIMALYMLLRTYFSGGIYGIIVLEKDNNDQGVENPIKDFLVRSAAFWPGFIKASLFSILVYLLAIFLGAFFAKLVSMFGFFWQVVIFLFFMLLGSIYIQLLKARLVSGGAGSVTEAIRFTRPIISQSAFRLIAGNLAVVIVGAVIVFMLWKILAFLRGFGWNVGLAALSIIFEQVIIFTICLMQVIRINFNYSIIKRGEIDVVGRTELGGV
jgi:hypothetical protein